METEVEESPPHGDPRPDLPLSPQHDLPSPDTPEPPPHPDAGTAEDLKIDGDKRLEFVQTVLARKQTYTEEEYKMIKQAVDLDELFEDGAGEAVKLPSPLTTAKKMQKNGESKGYGMARTTVRAR
jgi:hypothetical protein